ncbi:MAG: hypothetical protein JEZ06_10485 [Anaerolineaceae bacterium]|nr:hypothetical protein [Anaerolineaceae bacterium]
MPPKFRLQSILDYHHSRVESMEIQLSVLLQAKDEAVELMNSYKQKKENSIKELTEAQQGVLDLQFLLQARVNIHALQKLIEKQKDDIRLIDQAINEKREEIIEAKQDEAIFDKLREKELHRYIKKLEENERSAMSDIYISQAYRQSLKDAEEEIYR